MDLGISGRVVAITGGGGALGSAMAHMFAAEGAKVAVVDLNASTAQASADAIEAAGGTAIAATCDIRDRSQVDAVRDTIDSAFGSGIDILVNNAGFSRDSYLTKMDEENWDLIHDTVLKGTFHFCRSVLPGMIERRYGRIVNISSLSHLGNAGQTNYSSAKAGLIGFTNALARESGRFNITANVVAPGLIVTERLRQRPDFDQLEATSRKLTAMPRSGEPDDIAKAVLFFASSLADWITAQTLHVSGGR